jgi:hypothetical protein
VKHRFLAACLISTALAVATACSSAKDRSTHWLTAVQQAHSSVDSYQATSAGSGGRRSAAVDAAEQAVRAAIAQAPRAPNERERWVIQDLHYRLAQLLTDSNREHLAEPEIERGLSVEDAPTLARANLLALQGKLLERRGELEAAARAYHAALLVNEVLMDRALNGSTEREKGRP